MDPNNPSNVRFSYSVVWNPTEIDFAHRFDKYLDQDFFEHKVLNFLKEKNSKLFPFSMFSNIFFLFFSFFFFKIHWFSIFNSFMMVIFLVGLVSIILLRTLRKDFARYDKKDGLSDMVQFLLLLFFSQE